MLSNCSPLPCHDRIGNADRMENVESKKWECEVLRLPTRSKTGRSGACAQTLLCLPKAVRHLPLARPRRHSLRPAALEADRPARTAGGRWGGRRPPSGPQQFPRRPVSQAPRGDKPSGTPPTPPVTLRRPPAGARPVPPGWTPGDRRAGAVGGPDLTLVAQVRRPPWDCGGSGAVGAPESRRRDLITAGGLDQGGGT